MHDIIESNYPLCIDGDNRSSITSHAYASIGTHSERQREEKKVQEISDVEAVVGRFVDAIETASEVALNEVYDDKIVVWQSLTDTVTSKSENIAGLAALFNYNVKVRYFLIEQIVFGNRVVRRQKVECTTEHGRVFVMPVCIFMTIAGDKIIQIDEYIDSNDAKRLGDAIAEELSVAPVSKIS